MGVSSVHLEEHLRAVAEAGGHYGLEPRQASTSQRSLRDRSSAERRDGSEPEDAYLGSLVSEDGRSCTEVARRIGRAGCDFKALAKVWRRSNLSRERKVQIYKVCIELQLLYGLAVSVLVKVDLKELDEFQSRCLRTMFNIKAACVSQVSNAKVLKYF
jgi:hypothetical protein